MVAGKETLRYDHFLRIEGELPSAGSLTERVLKVGQVARANPLIEFLPRRECPLPGKHEAEVGVTRFFGTHVLDTELPSTTAAFNPRCSKSAATSPT